MFSKFWFVNLALALVLVWLGIKTFHLWSEKEETILEKRVSGHGQERPARRPPGKIPGSEPDYEVIVNKDLFSPSREAYKGKDAPGSEGPARKEDKRVDAALKQMSLFGVVIVDERKRALIQEPGQPHPAVKGRPQEPGKRQKWVEINESVGEFRVTDIRRDSVTLTVGGADYELLLYDREKPKIRELVRKEAGPLVVVGGAGTVQAPAQPGLPKGHPQVVTQPGGEAAQAGAQAKPLPQVRQQTSDPGAQAVQAGGSPSSPDVQGQIARPVPTRANRPLRTPTREEVTQPVE